MKIAYTIDSVFSFFKYIVPIKLFYCIKTVSFFSRRAFHRTCNSQNLTKIWNFRSDFNVYQQSIIDFTLNYITFFFSVYFSLYKDYKLALISSTEISREKNGFMFLRRQSNSFKRELKKNQNEPMSAKMNRSARKSTIFTAKNKIKNKHNENCRRKIWCISLDSD